MADPHHHGNSCQSLGWASMSQQKWVLFVQISFLAVHEKSTGGNPDASASFAETEQLSDSAANRNNGRTVMRCI